MQKASYAQVLGKPLVQSLANVATLLGNSTNPLNALRDFRNLLGVDEQGSYLEDNDGHFVQCIGKDESLRAEVASLLEQFFAKALGKRLQSELLFLAKDVCGLQLGINGYNALMGSLIDGGQLHEARSAFFELQSGSAGRDVKPDARAYATIIRAFCGRNELVSNAMDLFNDMKRHGVGRTADIYGALIRGCVFKGDLHQAETLFAQMRDADGLEPTTEIFNFLMEGYVLANNRDKVLQLLQELRGARLEPNVHTHSAVVRAHCRMHDLGTAERYASEVESGGTFLDKPALEALFRAHLARRSYNDAQRVIERRQQDPDEEQENYQFTDRLYKLFMGMLLRDDLENEAGQVFERYRREQYGDASTTRLTGAIKHEALKLADEQLSKGWAQALASGMAPLSAQDGGGQAALEKRFMYEAKDMLRQRLPRQALDAIQQLYAHGVTSVSHQNYGTINSVMFQLKKIKDLHSIVKLLDLMQKLSVPVESKQYNIIIDTCAKKEQMGKAEEAFEHMAANPQAQPDEFTFSSLIAGFAKIGRMDKAGSYVLAMQQRGLRVSERIYTALVDGYAKVGNKTMVVNTLNQMKANGLRVNVITWTSIIKGLMEIGHTSDALQTFIDMKTHHHVKPDLFLFVVLINGFSRLGEMDHAARMFDEMRESLPRRSTDDFTVAYNVLINGYARIARMDRAIALFNQMVSKSSQARPNVKTYTSLVDGYIRAHRLDKAQQLFARMKEVGIAPNLHTYTLLIRELAEIRRVKEAQALFDEMLASGIHAQAGMEKFIVTGLELQKIKPIKQFRHEQRFQQQLKKRIQEEDAKQQEPLLQEAALRAKSRASDVESGADASEAAIEDGSSYDGFGREPTDERMRQMLGEPLGDDDDEFMQGDGDDGDGGEHDTDAYE